MRIEPKTISGGSGYVYVNNTRFIFTTVGTSADSEKILIMGSNYWSKPTAKDINDARAELSKHFGLCVSFDDDFPTIYSD